MIILELSLDSLVASSAVDLELLTFFEVASVIFAKDSRRTELTLDLCVETLVQVLKKLSK